jgi:hypothetical protein
MKLNQVGAGHGVWWVRRAFGLFFKRPWAFVGLFIACFIGALFLNVMPLIGPVLVLAALPLGSLAFMIASRAVLDDLPILPGVPNDTLRGPRARRLALLQLGLAYAVATILIMLLANASDGGALERLFETLGTSATPESMAAAMADPRLGVGMVVRFGLAGLLSVPFWHAPALVHWGGYTATKSLFFSTVACWRNRGAFLVYGAVWVAVILLLGVVANLVAAVLGQAQPVVFFMAMASLIVSAAFYVSLYFTFDDCFVQEPPPAAA